MTQVPTGQYAVTPTTASAPTECPTWHSPLLRIVAGGIEVRCKSCRYKVVHLISRERIEQIWNELNAKNSR